MSENKFRTAQRKGDKSITITLPIKETGIKPGDDIMFEVISERTVLLTGVKKEEIHNELGTVDKIFRMLGLQNIVHYRLKNDDEIRESVTTDKKESTLCLSE